MKTIKINESQRKRLFEAYREGFSFDNLSMIGRGQFWSEDNLKTQYAYCVKYLGEPFSNGSTRYVFTLSDNTVLKLARCGAGVEQNEHEYDVFNESNKSDLLTRIFAVDDDLFTWMVSEAVLPAEEEDFEKILGMPYYDSYLQDSQKTLDYSSKNRGDHKVGYNKYFDNLIPFGTEADICVEGVIDYMQGFGPGDIDPNVYDEVIRNNEWFTKVDNLLKSLPTKYRMVDLFIGNFGIVNRNGNQELVILDSGA